MTSCELRMRARSRRLDGAGNSQSCPRLSGRRLSWLKQRAEEIFFVVVLIGITYGSLVALALAPECAR